MVTVVVFEFGR
ncbi:hypothetical protein VC87395_003366A, partial [Vibrio paracholerae 87395]